MERYEVERSGTKWNGAVQSGTRDEVFVKGRSDLKTILGESDDENDEDDEISRWTKRKRYCKRRGTSWTRDETKTETSDQNCRE